MSIALTLNHTSHSLVALSSSPPHPTLDPRSSLRHRHIIRITALLLDVDAELFHCQLYPFPSQLACRTRSATFLRKKLIPRSHRLKFPNQQIPAPPISTIPLQNSKTCPRLRLAQGPRQFLASIFLEFLRFYP